ncbi:Leucine rich repeat domain containing protein, partial [Balamuthia mandrillaris]
TTAVEKGNPYLREVLQQLHGRGRLLSEEQLGRKVDLCKNLLGPEGAALVADGLKRNATANAILLGADEIGAEGARAIATALLTNKSLRTVFLGCNDIGAEGARALASALQINTTVKGLWLKRNNIRAEGVSALVSSLLTRSSPLLVLDLVYNHIGLDGIPPLVSLLKAQSSPVVLYLSGNRLGAEGARQLVEALQHNAILRELYLDVNEIGDEGAKAIASMWLHRQPPQELGENERRCSLPDLRVLTLSSNDIGDEGAVALADCLSNGSSSLKFLSLGYWRSTKIMGGKPNRIGDEGGKALARMLALNNSLIKLDLQGNLITSATAVSIASALSHQNTTLLSLNLNGNRGLGTEGVTALARGLSTTNNYGQPLSSLVELNLMGCINKDEDLLPLNEMLESNHRLLRVVVGGPQRFDVQRKRMRQLLKTNLQHFLKENESGMNDGEQEGELQTGRSEETAMEIVERRKRVQMRDEEIHALHSDIISTFRTPFPQSKGEGDKENEDEETEEQAKHHKPKQKVSKKTVQVPPHNAECLPRPLLLVPPPLIEHIKKKPLAQHSDQLLRTCIRLKLTQELEHLQLLQKEWLSKDAASSGQLQRIKEEATKEGLWPMQDCANAHYVLAQELTSSSLSNDHLQQKVKIIRKLCSSLKQSTSSDAVLSF